MTSSDNSGSAYPVREAFRRFYPSYRKAHPGLSPEQRKAAACIMRCKTGEMRYTMSVCEKCGEPIIHAVSCNNRSCPCCQAVQTAKWEAERGSELVKGISYFHVIFTVPHQLNALFLSNMKLLLDLLLSSVRQTLLDLCADRKFLGAMPGILEVLHTWGQQLNFHPHVHVCISGGGLTPAGQFVETRKNGFFLPEAVVAKAFQGRFLCALKKLHDEGELSCSGASELEDPVKWQAFIDTLFAQRWLPFIKETFNGCGNAIRYLARYSYRTAISNSRIVSVEKNTVTFRYKDYADGSKEKLRTVSGEEFIGLFLQHILPKGFSRTRYAGYLTSCRKTKCLKHIHLLRDSVYQGNPYRRMKIAELLMTLYGCDICTCKECGGKLLHLPRGLPANMLPPLPSLLPLAVC